MSPDLNITNKFLDALDQDGEFTFQTFSDKKNQSKNVSRVFHGTLIQHQDTLTKLNAQGAGIFVMVNQGDGLIHSPNKTCRTNANITRIRSMFVDLDGAPLDPVLRAESPPDMIIESSPGRWHAYWLVKDCPLDQFSIAQVELAKKFSGDPSVKDLARVLRLPGFYHQKTTPFMTRIHRIGRLMP